MGKGRIFSASLLVGTLVLALHSPAARAAFACSSSPTVAVIEGQEQPWYQPAPCAGGAAGHIGGTQLLKAYSSVDATAFGNEGSIKITETAQGNSETDIGLTVTDIVHAFIPTGLLFLMGLHGNSVHIGNTTYDLTSVGLFINGDSLVTVTNGEQATGIYVDEKVSGTTETSESASTEVGPCGGTMETTKTELVCPGINKGWGLTLSVADVEVPVINFSYTMSEIVSLDTVYPFASNPVTVDASDPFEITGMALVDANGQVLPSVTFSDDSGFVYPSLPSPATLPGTDVPEPASTVMLGTAFLGLAALRMPRRWRGRGRERALSRP
jgi:hypothetical protein